nr:unnamed protein product [Callosobruchus analis]
MFLHTAVCATCERKQHFLHLQKSNVINTRGCADYFIKFHRVARSRNGLNYYGPKLFNVLPDVSRC